MHRINIEELKSEISELTLKDLEYPVRNIMKDIEKKGKQNHNGLIFLPTESDYLLRKQN